jgi:hypothetical protein
MPHPEIWAIVCYFILIVWGIMFSLAEQAQTPTMWLIPKSSFKKGALGLVIPFCLVFFNRPTKPEIEWLVGIVAVLFAYGFSDFLIKERRNIAAFILCCCVSYCLLGLIAWHFWPAPVAASVVVRHDDQIFPQEQLHTSETVSAKINHPSSTLKATKADRPTPPSNGALILANNEEQEQRPTQETREQPAIFLDCESVTFPIPFPAFSTIYEIDAGFPKGMAKYSNGAASSMFPRPDFGAWGFKCEFINYEEEPMFNISTEFTIRFKPAIHAPGTSPTVKTEGTVIERVETSHVEIPRIEAKGGKFELFIVNLLDGQHFIDIGLPSTVRLEMKESEEEQLLPVRIVNKSQAKWMMTLTPSPLANK